MQIVLELVLIMFLDFCKNRGFWMEGAHDSIQFLGITSFFNRMIKLLHLVGGFVDCTLPVDLDGT